MDDIRFSDLIRRQPVNAASDGLPRKFLRTLRPSQAWLTFLLLTLSLLAVTGVLDGGDWFKTPYIHLLVTVSTITGMSMANVHIKSIFLHPLGIIFGIVCVFTASTSLIPDVPLTEKYWEVWLHLKHWYDVASGEGINRDLVPYSFAFGILAWFLGYVGAWWTFRHNNVWVPIFTSGVSILTALSFLPGLFSIRFYIFVLMSMLLIAHMTTKISTVNWRISEAKLSKTDSLMIMQSAIWFTAFIIIVASILPMKVYTPDRAAQIWDFFRTPISSMEDEFTRLLGNVPSKTGGHGRHFGKFLPFIGSISFKNSAVLWSKSDYPGYWSSRAYNIYTSEGWMSDDTEENEFLSSERKWKPNSEAQRVSTKQELQFDFPSRKFMVSGNLEWVSENATLESLKPKTFVINLTSADEDHELPEYIANIAKLSREYINSYKSSAVTSHESAKIEDFIKDNTSELELTYVQRDKGKPISMRLTRTLPITEDHVSYRFDRQIPANKSVSMISHVSVATDVELQSANNSYPGYIRDHYLNYPKEMPKRIESLAHFLTYQEANVFDKTVAIEKYLRSDDFTYSRTIEAPPVGEDGVDFFLFESKTGYSDYFASAMAVMLRTQGIPTRLMAGYSSGEYNSLTLSSTIRDSDSHGWVQVYFPEYGWIDFEPTPAWDRPGRELRNQDSPFVRSDNSDAGTSSDGMGGMNEDFMEGINPEEILVSAEQKHVYDFFKNKYFIGSLSTVVLFIVILSSTWGLVRFRFRKMTNLEKKYDELVILGNLCGIKKQPSESILMYGAKLGVHLPIIETPVLDFCKTQTSNVYSRFGTEGKEEAKVYKWGTIRRHLLINALKRTIGKQAKVAN